MNYEYLKKASKTPATGEDDTREIVAAMLAEIETGCEEKVREYARSAYRMPSMRSCSAAQGQGAAGRLVGSHCSLIRTDFGVRVSRSFVDWRTIYSNHGSKNWRVTENRCC